MRAKWAVKKLGEITTVFTGYAFDSKYFTKDKSSGVPIVRIRDVKNQPFTEANFTGLYDDSFLVKNGDTLITMDGEFIASGWTGSNALLNQRVATLRNFDEAVLPEWIFLQLKSYLKQIEDKTYQTTVKHLSPKQIREIPVLVPSKEEQKKIVERLDAIRKAQELNDRLIAKTQELNASTLNSSVKTHEDIKEQELSKLCKIITDGAHNVPPLVESGVPMLDGSDIEDMAIHSDMPKKYISKETDSLLAKRCKPQADDVLLSSRGTIGKIAIVKDQNFNIMGNIILVRPNLKLLSSQFLANYLIVNRDHFLRFALGTSQKGLYLKDVRKLKVFIPAKKEQQKIVEKLDAIQKYKNLLLDQKGLYQELLNSTLHKSLSGELD